MIIHAAGIAGVVAGIVLCSLLPFLPGRYDPLAVPLSTIAQIFGLTGLLLVPIGALWTASAYSRRLGSMRRGIAIAALAASSLVWLIASLAALTFSVSLGVGACALWAWLLVRVWSRVRNPARAASGRVHPAAMYLLVVPIAVQILQSTLVPRAIEYSRDLAIRSSGPMIADIERFRDVHGRYPQSLLSVWRDYSPGLIGIDRFHYEPSAEAYNLVFEQFTYRLGTREFVVYNPRDGHAMTSHAMDLLEFSGPDLDRRRGYYAVHDTRHPHWKYFWFD